MHVLMVNAHGPGDPRAGGVEAGLTTLSAGLIARGHTVSYLVAFPGGRAEPGIDETVLHATDWRDDPVRRLRNHAGDVISRPTKALTEAVARHRPDLVHTNNLPGISTAVWEVEQATRSPGDAHAVGLPPALSAGDDEKTGRDDAVPAPPAAVWIANPAARPLGRRGVVRRRCLRLHPRAVRRPLPHCRSGCPTHPDGVAGGRTPFAPSCEPTEIDRLHRRTQHGKRSRRPALGCAGPGGARCELHVAGGGPLVEDVEAAARSAPFIHYHGVVSGAEKGAFFDRCDAGIVPSVWAEPGGPNFTLGEWLCGGRPVLVSGRGGLGEVSDLYPWAVRIEPTVDGVEQAFRELAEPVNWEAIRARIRPVQTAEQVDQWLTAHEVIYGGLLSGRSPITSS